MPVTVSIRPESLGFHPSDTHSESVEGVVEDIVFIDDRGMQLLLKEVPNEKLTVALKTAPDEIKDKIFRNMSERAAQMIKEEMEFMGPVRVSDVEAAQQRIVDIVRRLEDAGDGLGLSLASTERAFLSKVVAWRKA